MGQLCACARLVAFLCLVAVFALSRTKNREKSIAEIESRAISFYQQEKFSEAFTLYRQGADLGSARSQTILAYMYAFGQGTSRDPRQAFEWMSKAAEQGYAGAEVRLARSEERRVGEEGRSRWSP